MTTRSLAQIESKPMRSGFLGRAFHAPLVGGAYLHADLHRLSLQPLLALEGMLVGWDCDAFVTSFAAAYRRLQTCPQQNRDAAPT